MKSLLQGTVWNGLELFRQGLSKAKGSDDRASGGSEVSRCRGRVVSQLSPVNLSGALGLMDGFALWVVQRNPCNGPTFSRA